jgi:hypothetical protein
VQPIGRPNPLSDDSCLLQCRAIGRCPQSGATPASQSTISHLENAPRKTEAVDQPGASIKPRARRPAPYVAPDIILGQHALSPSHAAARWSRRARNVGRGHVNDAPAVAATATST